MRRYGAWVTAVVGRRTLCPIEITSRYHIERIVAHPSADSGFQGAPCTAVECSELGRHIRIVGNLLVRQVAHFPVGVGDLVSLVVRCSHAAHHLLGLSQRQVGRVGPFFRSVRGRVIGVQRICRPQGRLFRLVITHCEIARVGTVTRRRHVGDVVAYLGHRSVRCGQFRPRFSQCRCSCSRGRVWGRIASFPARSSIRRLPGYVAYRRSVLIILFYGNSGVITLTVDCRYFECAFTVSRNSDTCCRGTIGCYGDCCRTFA